MSQAKQKNFPLHDSLLPLDLPHFHEGQVLQRGPEGARWTGQIWHDAPVEKTRHLNIEIAHTPAGPTACKFHVHAGNKPGWHGFELSGVPAGGPFTLRISDGTHQVERNFYVGDLWLMAGQSNMEGVGLMADAALPHPLIRNLTMARVWQEARDPLHWMPESPDRVHNYGYQHTPEVAAEGKAKAVKGSGVGVHFARQMLEMTGVPQGLISCAHGGTSMAQWSADLAGKEGESLYGSLMLSMKMVNQKIAGVLWYQGCSDANIETEGSYTNNMVALVKALRRDLGQPELPWITVQIGTEIGRTWQTESWHGIQEQQRLLPSVIPHLDVCASADLEHDDWIHLSGKAFPVLARRMAHLARRLVLGEGFQEPNPQPVEAVWAPDHLGPMVEIRCAHVAGNLASIGKPLGFTLADQNNKECRLVYQVRYDHNRVLLRLTGDDLNGLYVHHGLGTEPEINTYDARGLPLPVFGPLAIKGLPPVSSWFRSWTISPAMKGFDLSSLDARAMTPDATWTNRRFEGWNVINMKEDWKSGPECRVFISAFRLDETMDLEVQAGGDGSIRVWIGDGEVIHDLETCQDLGKLRTSKLLRLKAGKHQVRVAMDNRGGESFGFYLRLARKDITALDHGRSIPEETGVQD